MPEIRRAMRLEDIYKTISPEPLRTKEDLDAYYRVEINELRGPDKIRLMKLGLERAFGSLPYKAFLMGHSGVGKSTEITRLINEVTDKYQAIRFSATAELDPINFQPFDILLLMMAELVERTAKPREEGGAGAKPSDDRLKEIWDWFATETETRKKAEEKSARLSAGVGPDAESWWAKAVGLFASLKGEMKFASARETKVVTYRLSRLSDLIEAANRLVLDCNGLLRKAVRKEWLIIGEDFDKAGIPLQGPENLFVTYGNVIKNLGAHMIFVIPITLGYSSRAGQFPVPSDHVHILPDTPVFEKDHKPHTKGRASVRAVLEARMSLDLFGAGQLERVIVASGGNLRDLFTLIAQASDLAILREAPQGRIGEDDVSAAIQSLRTEYERRLGENPYETPQVSYEDKAKRLVRIYKNEPESDTTDAVLYSLLRSRAVQEFNGERWFGVHPLVVDVLVSHERIPRRKKGSVPGGTR